jgi:uncharacterized membrane protein YcaP (DUF421 family)
MDLDAIFGATGHVTWLQECARAVLIGVYGLVLLRLAGRRLFARWSALDFVVAMVVGSSLSRALTGNADLFGTLAATALLIALHWATARAASRFRAVSRLVEGDPVPVGTGGELDHGALQRHGVSRADLEEALRAAGVESAHETRVIVLEPSGKLSVLKPRP